MKKLLFVGALATLTLASCKKDYTCQCTVTTTTPEYSTAGFVVQQGSTTTTAATPVTINDKEANAKTECEKGSKTMSTPSPYASVGAEPTTIKTVCAIK